MQGKIYYYRFHRWYMFTHPVEKRIGELMFGAVIMSPELQGLPPVNLDGPFAAEEIEAEAHKKIDQMIDDAATQQERDWETESRQDYGF